ncbi:MAG: N-acetyltransferase family protein [bacterium]
MNIRVATENDLPAILTIYNHAILTSTASYDYEPQSLDMRKAWLRDKKMHGFPVFVIEDTDGVAGFATYGTFREKFGYRYTVEHSIYITEGKRGMGYGQSLMSTLIESAQNMEMHVMIAGIDASNEGSINFHKKFGFEEVAHFKEVGYKFDRWLDVIFMQKML